MICSSPSGKAASTASGFSNSRNFHIPFRSVTALASLFQASASSSVGKGIISVCGSLLLILKHSGFCSQGMNPFSCTSLLFIPYLSSILESIFLLPQIPALLYPVHPSFEMENLAIL